VIEKITYNSVDGVKC